MIDIKEVSGGNMPEISICGNIMMQFSH